MDKSFVYEPFGMSVHDWCTIRWSAWATRDSPPQGTHLSKEPTPEDTTPGIQPVNDRISVLLHRGSEDDQSVPS